MERVNQVHTHVPRVAGKVVVVTGAARGQGRAEALALAREGAMVVATDVEEVTAQAGLPGDVTYRRLDVSRPEDWRELGEWLRVRHGRVDGLVNNAGIPFRARIPDITVEDWNRVLSVNLT